MEAEILPTRLNCEMDMRQEEELKRLCGSAIRFHCPLAPHTTFRVGGEVEAFYEAKGVKEFQKVIAFLSTESIPYLVLGRGSNLLVKDEGLEGVAVLLRGSLARIQEYEAGGSSIECGGGLPLSDLLAHCRRVGLGGIEFLAGIPGTVGGAVSMNSGAFGEEIGSWVREIEVITSSGNLIARTYSELHFSYRSLEMERGSVIVKVRFDLDRESPESVAMRISKYLKKRRRSQPLDYPSAGSVFKNPPNDFAGRLIEEVGLKGKRVGGAMISPKHGNFIVNTGDASAKDVLALLQLAQRKVKEKTGIQLEPEIQVVGR